MRDKKMKKGQLKGKKDMCGKEWKKIVSLQKKSQEKKQQKENDLKYRAQGQYVGIGEDG